MAYEGSLTDTPFSEVLLHIGRSGDTGILTLQGADEIVGVTFLGGAIVSVDAVNQAPEDGLGTVLDDSNLVPLEEFAGLVAENRAGGGRVIDLLLERDYLSREQLLAALREQTLRLCEQASDWESGHFRFYRGDQVSYEEGIEPLSVEELLERMARTDRAVAPTGTSAAQPPRVPEVEILELDAETSEVELPDLPPIEVPEVEIPAVEVPPPVEMPEESYADSSYRDLEFGTLDYPDIELPEPDAEAEVAIEGEPPSRRSAFEGWWGDTRAPAMPGRLLALGLLVSMVGLVLWAPGTFLLPLDGQERIRSGIARGVESSTEVRISRALRAHFQLDGRFPETLDALAARGLVDGGDLAVAGGPLAYRAAGLSYQIGGAATAGDRLRTESVTGNFLLDPDFSPPEILETPPLVLLDG